MLMNVSFFGWTYFNLFFMFHFELEKTNKKEID